jgi:hypothetical protein
MLACATPFHFADLLSLVYLIPLALAWVRR